MWSMMIFSLGMLSLALAINLNAVKEHYSTALQKAEIADRQSKLIALKKRKIAVKKALANRIYGDVKAIDKVSALSYTKTGDEVSNRTRAIADRKLEMDEAVITEPVKIELVESAIKQVVNDDVKRVAVAKIEAARHMASVKKSDHSYRPFKPDRFDDHKISDITAQSPSVDKIKQKIEKSQKGVFEKREDYGFGEIDEHKVGKEQNIREFGFSERDEREERSYDRFGKFDRQ